MLISTKTNNCATAKQKADRSQTNWVKLRNNNWLFSSQHPQLAIIVCGEDVTTLTIPINGKISLKEGCTLKVGLITLKSHKTIKSRVDLSFLPAVNLSTNWTTLYNTTILQEVPNEGEFTVLHKKIAELQDASVNVSTHDVHHYAVTYIIVGFILIGVIAYQCKVRRRAPRQDDYRLEAPAATG